MEKDKKLSAQPVDWAPLCEGLDDLFSHDARRTAGRVLRQFLDENVISVLELMFSPTHLKLLSRTGNLQHQAIGLVSTVQAREAGVSSAERSKVLEGLATQLLERINDNDGPAMLATFLKKDGPVGLMVAVSEKAPAGFARFSTLGAIAVYLQDAADIADKIGLILDLVEQLPGEMAGSAADALAYLDDVLGELLDSQSTLMELLGRRADLADAVRVLTNVSKGTLKPMKSDHPALVKLNETMAQRSLPLASMALHGWIGRSIGGMNPLTREGKEAEKEAFGAIVQDLAMDDGLIGGASVAEAVTHRARATFSDDPDNQDSEAAIIEVIDCIPPPGAKMGYLLDVSTAAVCTKKLLPTVMRGLTGVMNSVENLDALIPATSDQKEQAGARDRLRQRLKDSGLPQEAQHILGARLIRLGGPEEADNVGPRSGSSQTFLKGETIFEQGDPGVVAYLIKSGSVEINVKVGDQDIQLSVLNKNNIIGEMSLIDDMPRMATAIALELTETVAIRRPTFKRRLDAMAEADPILRHLMDVFAGRLRSVVNRL